MAGPNVPPQHEPHRDEQRSRNPESDRHPHGDRERKPWTVGRILRNVFGVLLVLLGIVGLVLPFLQGVLFLVIGLAMIDLPIKHRVHMRLMRYGWYRKLASKHEEFWHKWHARRARKRAERQRRKELAAGSATPPTPTA